MGERHHQHGPPDSWLAAGVVGPSPRVERRPRRPRRCRTRRLSRCCPPIGFVNMTPHVREAGAFFSYVTEGLGKRLGMGVAVVALIAYTAIQLGVYGFMGWAVDDTVKRYGGPEVPWPVYALVTIGIVAVLACRHIHLSAKVLGVADSGGRGRAGAGPRDVRHRPRRRHQRAVVHADDDHVRARWAFRCCSR